MNNAFSQYGQQETDTKAVDYLQTQVSVVWCINSLVFILLISLLFAASALSEFPRLPAFISLVSYQKTVPFTRSSSLLKKSSLQKRKNPSVSYSCIKLITMPSYINVCSLPKPHLVRSFFLYHLHKRYLLSQSAVVSLLRQPLNSGVRMCRLCVS